MKLQQTIVDDGFEQTLKKWMETVHENGYSALFHVYIPYNLNKRDEKLEYIRNMLQKHAKEVPVMGCSAIGEIHEGQLQDKDPIVSITLFEKASTHIEVLPFYAKYDEADSLWLLKHAGSIPDLKGIEILTSATYQKLEYIGRIIDTLPENIEIFGGVAVGDEKHPQYVFANDAPISETGSACVFYSGPELHFQANRMFGWKPIGYPLKVTKSDGPLIYEIDGKPAYDVYHRYLHIKKDDNFFYDALVFPWEVRVNEETAYLRHAKSVNPDGSILMSSNIPEGSEIRITYGDPRRIMEHTRQTALVMKEFGPEVVHIVNCFGRKLFWSEKEDIEISALSKLMTTTGFSALGEIMRYKGTTLMNNLSIVTVAMREGDNAKTVDVDDIEIFEKSTNIPVTARLALFINTISEELMEKNKQLNEMLYKASHDALTGLLNRGTIENTIYEKAEVFSDWHLIMFDVDDFKKINDKYGHKEGDVILKAIAQILSESVNTLPNAYAGRWGGEEFMVLVCDHSDDEIFEIARNFRTKIKNGVNSKRPVTISIGTTRHHDDESIMDTANRADEFLYQAKAQGKDRVCSDLSQ